MGREHDLPDGIPYQWMETQARRLQALEHITSSGPWTGDERRENGAAFSDEQRRQIIEMVAAGCGALVTSDAFNGRVDSRLEVNEGRKARGFYLWLAGAFGTGGVTVATAAIIAYFKLKGG